MSYGDRPGPTHDLREFVSRVYDQLEEVLKRLASIERKMKKMATQLEQMDEKLTNIADAETKLGTDIQTVIAALKNIPNPPADLTAQLAKLDVIAQTLIDTDVEVLSNLPPTP